MSPANTYVLGDYKLNKNVRYSAGIDQKFSPRVGANVLFNYYDQDQLPRGMNLNPVVNGVRQDPAYGNIISTVTDAQLIRHELCQLQLQPAAPSPSIGRGANGVARRPIHRHSSVRAGCDGSFRRAREWPLGHGGATALDNCQEARCPERSWVLSVNLTVNASDGYVYNETRD